MRVKVGAEAVAGAGGGGGASGGAPCCSVAAAQAARRATRALRAEGGGEEEGRRGGIGGRRAPAAAAAAHPLRGARGASAARREGDASIAGGIVDPIVNCLGRGARLWVVGGRRPRRRAPLPPPLN